MTTFKTPARKVLIGLVAVIISVVLYNVLIKEEFDYQQFFSQNQKELTMYAEQFFNQNKIVGITRYDLLFLGLSYSLERNYSDEEDHFADFEVPSRYRKNEEAFWQQDSTQIRSSKGTGEILLSEYLKSCNMTESEFRYWREFIKKFNFSYINKDKSNELVTIWLTPKTGFIYRKNIDVDTGYRDEKVVKLNDNWFYFDERRNS